MAADGREGREATSEAFAALEAGDTGGFLAGMARADSLRPGHPTLRYHLARAMAMNGESDGAMSILKGLADAGMRVTLDDAAFDGLREDPAFAVLQADFDVLGEPRMDGFEAYRGSDADLQPEGLARLDGAFLMGSVHKARIVTQGKPQDGSRNRSRNGGIWADTEGYSAMGMELSGGRLWSAQTMTPEGDAPDSLAGRSRVVAYDMEGRPAVVLAPSDTLDHWFGDLTVAPDGTVYVSDSRAPGIYRIKDGMLEPIVVGDPFTSPQGLAWMDGALYVADYSSGIFRLDPTRRTVKWLETPSDAVLLGIDGLEADPDRRRLLGIQNGTNPTRVVTIPVKGVRIGRVGWMNAAHPDHHDPTLGLVQNDTLFYVANSQWPLFAPGIPPETGALLRQPPVILAIPLDQDSRN